MPAVFEGGDLGLTDKGLEGAGVMDPQTQADVKSQQLILGSLERGFPGLTVIGEEEMELADVPEEFRTLPDASLLDQGPWASGALAEELRQVSLQDVVVWVDPLDGTQEFVDGYMSHVTVLIGVAVHGIPVAGVIHQPFGKGSGVAENGPQGRTMWGAMGLGVWLLHGPLSVGTGVTPWVTDVRAAVADRAILLEQGGLADAPARERVVATTRSHRSGLVEEALRRLSPCREMAVGGAGYKVICILEGKADAWVYTGAATKRWDTCAGEALLRSCSPTGHPLTDIKGCVYDYHPHVTPRNERGVVATMGDTNHIVSALAHPAPLAS
eukprot:jgi/Mesvir1/4348/Mv02432-RA.1